MELLAFGKTGWGDELFYATLMTIAVSITAMLIGFLFALIFTPLKLSKYKSLNLIGNFYTTVIRGVPELLVIYCNLNDFGCFNNSYDNWIFFCINFYSFKTLKK